MRTVAEGTAYANQTEIPVPGGFVSGLVDVIVGGADLGSGDYDDTNSMSIKLTVPMVFGTMFKVVAWTPNQTVVNAGGQLAGFRNKVINGNFDIWQRGTNISQSASTNSYGYVTDRWFVQAYGGSSGSGTFQVNANRGAFTLGQTEVPGEPAYYHVCGALQVGTVGGVGAMVRMEQAIEGVRTFAGQQATLSFWARADSARTYAVIVGQTFGSGGSPSAAVTAAQQLLSLTTTWKKFTISVSVPSIAGKTIGSNGDDALRVSFILYKNDNYNFNDTLGVVGTLSASANLQVSQVQLEAGSVATQFEQRPLGLELQLCQRYYEVLAPTNVIAGVYASGYCATPGCTFKAQKRAVPTAVISGISATFLTGVSFYNLYTTADQSGMIFNTTSAVGTLGIIIYTAAFSAEL
jgi:hypothetical protein